MNHKSRLLNVLPWMSYGPLPLQTWIHSTTVAAVGIVIIIIIDSIIRRTCSAQASQTKCIKLLVWKTYDVGPGHTDRSCLCNSNSLSLR